MSVKKVGRYGVAAMVCIGTIAVCAFVLSYQSLCGVAIDNGIDPMVAPLFPIVIDGLVIASAIGRLKYSMEGKPYHTGTIVMGFATAVSVGLNVAHAETTLLSQIIFSVPPVVLFVGTEMVLGMVQEHVGSKKKPKRSSVSMMNKLVGK